MIEKTEYHKLKSQSDFKTNSNITVTHKFPERSENHENNENPKKEQSVKAFILDLDGTLVDSMDIWRKIDRQFFKEQDLCVPWDIINQIKKMSVREWSEFFATEYQISLSPDQIKYRIEEIACDYYNTEVKPKPHMIEFLNFLDQHNIPYGIATAGYASATKTILNKYGVLERVKFILSGEEDTNCKNTPEIYQKGCKILKSTPETTCVVEDSLHCIQSAKKGGFHTIAVYDSYTSVWEWQESKKISDLYVKDLNEIIEHFSRFS
ncbi:MAG: HAD family phosphatase [Oscillospiraceae bacterium]|nr:HAD family phosphatase [Oscillospiraceae bacterium]